MPKTISRLAPSLRQQEKESLYNKIHYEYK